MIVLFWNTAKNNNNQIIAKMIEELNLDFLALAEYKDDLSELLQLVNKEKDNHYREYVNFGADNITLIGRLNNVCPVNQNIHYSIQIVNNKLIICSAHMPSRIYEQSDQRRKHIMQQMVNDLDKIETDKGIKDTIVVGDLNANPYEDECLSAYGLHGMPISEVTQKEKRQIDGRNYKMFYNPMWNLLGDLKYPPGTYYYSGSEPNNPYWYLLDQVLIRPSLRERFVDSSLKIIHKVADVSLVDVKGHPDKKISDHLPIVFEIKRENNE